MGNDLSSRPILVVDDDPVIRELVEAVLREFGATDIHALEDGKGVIPKVTGHDVQLLILDLMMPEVDAFELIASLARHHYDGKIIFISSAPKKLLEAASLLAKRSGLEVVGALQKPMYPEELKELLERSCSPTRSTDGIHDTGGGRSVLLVDDDPISIEFLSEALKGVGVEKVETTANGTDALSLLREDHSFDLLILDVFLPDISWREILTQIGATRFSGKIILNSAATEKVLLEAYDYANSIDINTAGWLRKPFTKREILGLVNDAA